MKKIIALMLVIFTLAALFVSCTDPGIDPNDSNPGTDDQGNPIEGFTSVNETVYVIAKGGLNARSTPEVPGDDEKDNKLGTLTYGQAVKRTGIDGDPEGWSRIIFNDEVAFVKTEYLDTEKPDEDGDNGNSGSTNNGTAVSDDKFTACNDKTEVYVTGSNDEHIEDGDATIYRTANRSDAAGSLKDGTEVTRVAVYYEDENDHEIGWSKINVDVDGETKTYYIRNSQLKIEMVKADTAE